MEPARTLNTDYSRLVESTLIVNGAVEGIDTSAFEQATLTGGVPQKWTLGGGLQWDGARGNRGACSSTTRPKLGRSRPILWIT